MKAWAALALLAVAVSGCTSAPGAGPGAGGAASPYQLGPMTVTFTPFEPNEPPGEARLAWRGKDFAGETSEPREMPPRVLRLDGVWYQSYSGMGWRRYESAPPGPLLADRLAGVDLRAILDDPAFRPQVGSAAGGTLLEARGRLPGAPHLAYHLVAKLDGGRIVQATLEGDGLPEGPYTFRPGPAPRFPFAVPKTVIAPADADRMDAQAGEAHGFVIGLIGAYARNHAGLLPQEVSPEELRVELLASGRSWPQNPYAKQPLAPGETHGAFRWTRCEPSVGAYGGYGWDGQITEGKWGPRECR